LAKQQTLNNKPANGNGANLVFETTMWTAADKLRNNMDAAEYKHVVLGLIFFKYILDAFIEVCKQLKRDPESGCALKLLTSVRISSGLPSYVIIYTISSLFASKH
jgi:hypothetical protein